MKIAIISRSDSTGGAAVASRRLTEALRAQGHEATMLVVEKKTDLPFVVKTEHRILEPLAFYAERAGIYLHNGCSRRNLFKVDTGAYGLPLWKHPVVTEADAIILNWVNQGMLSLPGIKKICELGKPVVWTMHDMWEITGICHHSMDCDHYKEDCGNCPLLGRGEGIRDLSWRTYCRKLDMYKETDIRFVAVSNWLLAKAEESSLMRGRKVSMIHNPFEIPSESGESKKEGRRRILFSAATVDNWIKGLDILKEAVKVLTEKYPETASGTELAFAGVVKNPESLEGFALPIVELGYTESEKEMRRHYEEADVIVNSSYFESFGCILMEGQAFGCVPVAFNRGGQSDIIEHLATGYLAEWDDDPGQRAAKLAEGIKWGLDNRSDLLTRKMRESVEQKFGYAKIAEKYIQLFEEFHVNK